LKILIPPTLLHLERQYCFNNSRKLWPFGAMFFPHWQRGQYRGRKLCKRDNSFHLIVRYLEYFDWLVKFVSLLVYMLKQHRTALIVASWRGHLDTVSLLLERGASVEAKTKVSEVSSHLTISNKAAYLCNHNTFINYNYSLSFVLSYVFES
jgi:hypothetical protein